MTGIQWTDETWNPVVGCTRASAGCDHCYAVQMTHRLEAMGQEKYAGLTVLNKRGDRHFNGVVRCVEGALQIPLRWRKPRRIFVNSMSDMFHPAVPFEFIDQVFAVMALCPQHTFQVLTKRPGRMAEYLNTPHEANAFSNLLCWMDHSRPGLMMEDICLEIHNSKRWCLPNAWLGTSCEDQAAADERIPHLLRCPAAVRFLSCEPLLGPVDILEHLAFIGEGHEDFGINWVIVGGESGKNARPCDIGWIRSIVQQCKAAGVPVFVKQIGKWPFSETERWSPRGAPIMVDVHALRQWEFRDKPRDPKGGDPAEWPADLRVREWPDRQDTEARRVGGHDEMR